MTGRDSVVFHEIVVLISTMEANNVHEADAGKKAPSFII